MTINGEKVRDINFLELVRIIWKSRLTILIATLIFAVVSLVYALSLPNIYKSDALLMPNTKDSSNAGLGALAGQFGAIASVAGINLKNTSDNKTGYALQVIKSREFLYKFIAANKLKPAICAAVGWDPELNELLYDESIFNKDNEEWVFDSANSANGEPTIFKAYKKFLDENFEISEDKKTGMIKLSVSHYSPVIARMIVEKLIFSINDFVKSQDIEEANKSIAYLSAEIESTGNASAQSMFYQLIEKQYQTLMLTKVRDQYVFRIVDKAIVPEQKSSPKRAVIVIFSTLVGFMLSVLFVLLFDSVKRRKRNL